MAGLVAAVVIVAADTSRPRKDGSSTGPLAGRAFPIEGQGHVPEGTDVEYGTNPPTSGDHWPEPASWGAYREPLPDEQLVHNLEHGGIWISYTGVDVSTLRKLESLAGRYPEAVILTPRPENDLMIAVASWGRLEELDSFDEQRIVAFISANVNRSPEPLASVDQPAVEVGEPLPAFEVTDAEGRLVTTESLQGRPSIVWFTTTYCVPCQVGAVRVAKLDDELGGEAFDVLVLFVDPQEQPPDLLSWRAEFAREDWRVALDTALAQEVEMRFLDTKILLDATGVIQNIDVNIADERYLSLIRREVQEAG